MAIWTSEIKELEKLYESLKGQLPDLVKELERLIKADDENMILLYSRRCLEVIITDLCECELKRPRKTEPLKGIIDKLHKEEKVPSHIITSMHGLNELSTYGAHPKDFDPAQVKPVLNNLDIIIKWYLKCKQIITIQTTEDTEEKVQLRDQPPLEEIKRERKKGVQEKPDKLYKNKVVLTSILILAVLAVAATFLYPKIFRKDTLETLRSSEEQIVIAIMPFQNLTTDNTKNFWQEIIQNNLITSLSESGELTVRQIESINPLLQADNLTNYTSITPSIAKAISQKLNANVFIHGSISQIGTIIRLHATLIESETEEVIKPFQIDGTVDNILHMADSLSVMVNNFLIITVLEKEAPPIFQQYLGSTKSPDALRYFIDGQNAYWKGDLPAAIEMLLNAVEIDSNMTVYTINTVTLAVAYSNLGLYDQAKKWSLLAYTRREQMPRIIKLWTNWLYAKFYETPYDEIKCLRQILEIDDQMTVAYQALGRVYFFLQQYDKAIPEFEKALAICKKWHITPIGSSYYTFLSRSYHKTGQLKKEERLYKKTEKDFPNDEDLIYGHAILSLNLGDTVSANRYIKRYISIKKERSISEATISLGLAGIYTDADILDKAEEYYRKALLLDLENPERLNTLAYFLIDKDRNVIEGLELVEKALELRPDHYDYLHTKGWGLYKMGKYYESSDVLQKSWNLRREHAEYFPEAYFHLEAAKKAITGQKDN